MSQEKKEQLIQFITTDESYHEGLNVVDDYINEAKEKGISTLALVDRCSLGMLVKFFKKCKQNDIKPIIGSRLRLDAPEIDYKDLFIKNIDQLKKLKSAIENQNNDLLKNIGVNFNTQFSTEYAFDAIRELKTSIEKYDASKSKTKDFVLYREIYKFLHTVSNNPVELKNNDFYSTFELFLAEELEKIKQKKETSIDHQKVLDTGLRYYLRSLVVEFDLEINEDQKKNIEKIKFGNEESIQFMKELLPDNFDLSTITSIQNNNLDELFKSFSFPINTNEFNTTVKNINSEPSYGDIVAIAINDEGYLNLKKIISDSYINGQRKLQVKDDKREMDQFPLSSLDFISANKKGLLFISMNDAKDIIFKYFKENKRNPIAMASILKEKLGDNLMFSVKKSSLEENNKIKDQEYELSQMLLEVAEKLNTPVFASHDARFARKDDYDSLDLKKAVLLGEEQYDPSREKEALTGQYLKTEEEIIESFKELPLLIENNRDITSIIDAEVRLDYYVLPKFIVPEDFEYNSLLNYCKENSFEFNENSSTSDLKEIIYNVYLDEYKEKHPRYYDEELDKKITNIVAGDYMKKISWEGIVEKMKVDYGDNWKEHEEEYRERFNYESDIINGMGFPSYFLIVYDFIRYAKQEADVPVGPGRGSGAGSLIAYGLDITDVDPIPTDLFFERFLNPERVSMPDFDIDFSQEGRGLIIQYVKEKYGEVAQIATQGRLKAKSVLKGVAGALGNTIPFQTSLVELVSDDPSTTLGTAIEDEAFLQKYNSEVLVRDIYKEALRLEGVKQNSGLHAGGVVIAPVSIDQHAPIQQSPNGEGKAVQFDKKDIEATGLVKFDFLGLKTLDIVKEAVRQVNDNPENDLNIRLINKLDEKTFELLKKAKTHGVFQLESHGMTQLVKKLQVESIEEMSALVALFRPGPMQSGMMDSYIDRKNGIEEVESMHEKLEDILSGTYGTMIYQEQVMQAAQLLAGYTLGGADQLRRAMGSKNAQEMQRNKAIFNNGALKENIEEDNKISSKFLNSEININLSGIEQLKPYLSEEGFFSSEDSVEKFLEKELSLEEEDIDYLMGEINNNKFHFEQMYPNSKDLLSSNKVNIELETMSTKIRLKLADKYGKENGNNIFASLTNFAKYNSIFFKIEQFAAYGFNKAHSYAYAVVAYQTAYLKANHPKEFFAAVCSFHNDDQKRTMQEKICETIYDMHSFDIELLNPSVNHSNYRFSVEGECVRYGLRTLKGLGETGINIEKERKENGEFLTLDDFLYRMDYRNRTQGVKNTKVSKKAFESLLYAGALDCFIHDDFPNKSMGRNYLHHKFSLITDNKVYPKENINKIVEDRLANGNYSEELVYTPNSNLNPLQTLICETIAHTKNVEDLFFNDEEKKSKREGLKKEKAEFTAKHKEFTKTFNQMNFEEASSPDSLKLLKKALTLAKKGFFDNLEQLQETILVDVKTNNPEFISEVEKVVFNVVPKDERYDDLSDTLKVVYLKAELDLIKKNNLINFLPEGLGELPKVFAEKDKAKKVQMVGRFIKERNPEALKIISSKVKGNVDITRKFALEKEKEITGIYISSHPVKVNNALSRFKIERERTPISHITTKANSEEFVHEIDGHYFNMIGVVKNLQVKKIKTGKNAGKDWASFTLEDETESIKMKMYSEVYELAKDYLADGTVLGACTKVESNDEWGTSAVVNEFKSYSPDMGDKPFISRSPKEKKEEQQKMIMLELASALSKNKQKNIKINN